MSNSDCQGEANFVLAAMLKCLCIENFEYTFLARIETSVFPMHEYHISFVLTGEKSVEISACFEALGANFDSQCVMS